MTVTKSNDQQIPATLTLSFGEPIPSTIGRNRNPSASIATASFVQDQPGTDRKEVIDVTNLRDSEIVARLTKLTNATLVHPTLEEQEQLQKLQEEKARSRQDALVNGEFLERKRQEKAVLDQIKGEVLGS